MLQQGQQIGDFVMEGLVNMKRNKRIIDNRKGMILGVTSLFIILLSTFVSAFAVGVPGDVSLYPGQTLDATFDIMNNGGEITVRGVISEGAEIVSFTKGDTFNVPGVSIFGVPVRYRIPADAPLGKVYTVKVMFSTISAGEGDGSVSFAGDVARSFNVIVGQAPAVVSSQPQPQEEKTEVGANVWLWVLGVIIIVIIIWFVLKKKK